MIKSKSRLLALEKIVLNMSQDNSNNDGKLINAISMHRRKFAIA